MSSYILYFREEGRFENQIAWLSKNAWLYNMNQIVIDTIGGMKYSDELPVFSTINEAIEFYKDYTWVFLDHRADSYIDEFDHPIDNVIYAVGSDYTGLFNDKKPEGKLIKMRAREEGEHYASLIVPILLYDRFLYLNGRRK